MGGREGLVDTAVRTSTSGYMQRRLVNALQDMVVENDGTVRNSDKNVIQFCFGDDGIDAMHTDHGAAVNLDVLLLKAKALNVNEVREEIKKVSSPKKAEPKKKTDSEKKPVKKVESAVKPDEKVMEEESLQQIFEEETGKKAIWHGKETNAYRDWKEKQDK